MKYKQRFLEQQINPLFKIFPIVTITGPRQSGKSTLIQHYIDSKWKYYTLDNRDILLRIQNDPTMFVNNLDSATVIDEAQKYPELFHSIKQIVDEDFPYKIILSGSANLLLLQSVTESLAGRAGFLELLPFSIAEAHSLKSNNILLDLLNSNKINDLKNLLISKQKKQISDKKLLNFIFQGGYPRIIELQNNNKNILRWFENYITAYIERDLRNLAQVGDLNIFQMVYKILSYQTGSIINFSSIAQDLGITSNTVKRYLSILETSYQFKNLSSYHIKQKKQIIKAKKIYMMDTGLINYFQQNENIDKMMLSSNWGKILENHVYTEIIKSINNISPKPPVFYWRTNNGAEVDFIIEYKNKLIPIEVKAGVQIRKSSIRGLKSFYSSQTFKKVPFCAVLYRGKEIYLIEKNIIAIPLSMFY